MVFGLAWKEEEEGQCGIIDKRDEHGIEKGRGLIGYRGWALNRLP